MKKKGDVWISAVLYMGLGVLALTLILSAGMPLVEKLKDKNIISQTKSLFFVIDENIRGVTNEGPGSRRYLDPVTLGKGEMYVEADRVWWKMKTTIKIMEPGIISREGSLALAENETLIVNEYLMNIFADYNEIAKIELISEYDNPFQGSYTMAIKNTGRFTTTDPVVPIVEIEVK